MLVKICPKILWDLWTPDPLLGDVLENPYTVKKSIRISWALGLYFLMPIIKKYSEPKAWF